MANYPSHYSQYFDWDNLLQQTGSVHFCAPFRPGLKKTTPTRLSDGRSSTPFEPRTPEALPSLIAMKLRSVGIKIILVYNHSNVIIKTIVFDTIKVTLSGFDITCSSLRGWCCMNSWTISSAVTCISLWYCSIASPLSQSSVIVVWRVFLTRFSADTHVAHTRSLW